MNIREIYNTHPDADTIQVCNGAVLVSYGDERSIGYIDKTYLNEQGKESIQEVNKELSSLAISKLEPIAWSSPAWEAARQFYMEKNSEFSITQLGRDYEEVEIDIPNELKQYFVLVKIPDSDLKYLCVSSNAEKQPEYKQIITAIGRAHHGTQKAFVSHRDLGVIRERAELHQATDAGETTQALETLKLILKGGIEKKCSDIHLVGRDTKNAAVGEGVAESYYRYRVSKSLQEKNIISYDELLTVMRTAWRTTGSATDTEYKETASLSRTVDVKIPINGIEKTYQFRFQQSKLDGGFKVVLRVIDSDIKNLESFTFEKMGYFDSQISMLMDALVAQKGAIIFAGVTNSGKTLSISRLLIELDKMRPDWAIDSIEDPIEYKLPMINQHPVNLSSVDNRGMNEKEIRNAATVQKLNDLLRMDPDAINVGEIRDKIFAEVFTNTVRTGHKAFSTLHTSSAFGVYSRLLGLGISMETLSEPHFINGIVWQTLVPTVCPHCSKSFDDVGLGESSKDEALKQLIPNTTDVRVADSDGCEHCNFSGKKGLTACAEIVLPNLELNSIIRTNDLYSATNHWKEKMLPDSTFDFKGITIEDAIIWKVYKGQVCPRVAESQLGMRLENAANQYSDRCNKILFNTKAKLKSAI